MSDATSDTRSRDGSASDRKTTFTQTMAATSGTATGAIVLIWGFNCINKHQIIVPTIDEALAMLAVSGPFIHQLGRIVMYWTGRLIPKDANP